MEQSWYTNLTVQETYHLETLREAQRNSGGMEPINVRAPDQNPQGMRQSGNEQSPWEEGDFWKTYQD